MEEKIVGKKILDIDQNLAGKNFHISSVSPNQNELQKKSLTPQQRWYMKPETKIKRRSYLNLPHVKLRIKKYYKEKRNRMREFLYTYKILGCVKCGYKEHPEIIEFHHLRDKKFNICLKEALKKSKKEIINEIAKCELLCPNCHRLETLKTWGVKHNG